MKKFFYHILLGVLSIVTFILLAVLIGTLIFKSHQSKHSKIQDEKILSIYFNSEIKDYVQDSNIDGYLSDHTEIGMYDIQQAIQKASSDDQIKGILFNGDSKITQLNAESLIPAIVKFKESGKFIFSYGTDYSQASYLLASYADSIYINPTGQIGLKGYASARGYFKDFIEKYKLDAEVFVSGKYKSYGEFITKNGPSEESKFQTLTYIGELIERMNSTISERRDIPMEKMEEITYNNESYTAKNCLNLGLVDKIIYKSDFLDTLEQEMDLETDKLYIPIEKYHFITQQKISSNENKIAVVYLEGEIVKQPSYGNIDPKTMRRTFREIRKNEQIEAILLRINSPGGSADASEQIWYEIELCKKQGLPVIVSMGQYAASGGYYIASGADKVYANPSTVTGSIGVFAMFFNFQKALEENLDIHFRSIQSGPFAGGNNGLISLNEEQKTRAKELTDTFYDLFKSRVAEGRDLTLKEVESLAQGRIYSGSDALEIDLVDELGDMSKALSYIQSQYNINDTGIEIYPKDNTNLVNQIKNKFAIEVKTQNILLKALDGEEIYENTMIQYNNSPTMLLPLLNIN